MLPKLVANIMKTIVCTLALLTCTCLGLQFPLSYQYRYTATVATGLPDVGSQRAAASIDTTVVVDTISSYSYAVIRFRDSRVGEQHGEARCGQLAAKHRRRLAKHEKELFHRPFHVNLRYSRRPVMEVPRDEPLWMTNVRKGVVSILRTLPTTEHLLTRPTYDTATNTIISDARITPLKPKTFEITEDTLHGSCLVQYVLTPASAQERHRLPALHKDIQQRAGKAQDGSWPKVSEHLYLLQRSPRYDSCTARPLLYQSTNQDEEGGSNQTHPHYGDFLTQSSLGRLLLRGENNRDHSSNLRLEAAYVEAGVEMKPLGVAGGTLQLITNQSLVLEATYYKMPKPRVPPNLVPVRTMKWEVQSPFAAPKQQPPDWIRYQDKGDSLYPVYPEFSLTGYTHNATDTARLQSKLLHECSEAASILETAITSHSAASSKSHRMSPVGATVAPEVGEHLASVTDIVTALSSSALQEVVELLKTKGDLDRQVFTEALAASGSPAALQLLLHEILDLQLPPARAYAALSSIASNLHSPLSAAQLFMFVKQLAARVASGPHSLDQRTGSPSKESRQLLEDLLSVGVLGTSAAIRRVCGPSNSGYYGHQFEAACDLQQDFLQFVKEQMEATPSPAKQAPLLYAAGHLPSPAAFQLVAEVASSNSSNTLRTAAIFSMMPRHTPHAFRQQVLSLLQPVLESQVEAPELRQVAAMTLLAWRPHQQWWLRWARASWTEQSKAVAQFVYTATKAVAELRGEAWIQQSSYALRALPLVRPVLAPSQQSFLTIIESLARPPMMESETKLGWILNVKTMLPQELFLSLNSRMNGFRIPLLEAVLLGDDLSSYWRLLQRGGSRLPPHTSSPAHTKLQWEFGDILHSLGSPSYRTSTAEGLLLLRLFGDTHQALPLSMNWLQQAAPSGWRPTPQQGEAPVHFVKYLDPVQRQVLLPSEVGLPVICRVQSPTLLYQRGRYRYSTQRASHPQHPSSSPPRGNKNHEDHFRADFSFEGNTTVSSNLQSTITLLVPWLNRTLVAGLQVKTGLAVPNASLGGSFSMAGPATDLHLFMRTDFDGKVPVGVMSHSPFTVFGSLGPGDDLPSSRLSSRLKEVRASQGPLRKSVYHLPSGYSGVTGHITYEGEGDRPRSLPYSPWAYLYPSRGSSQPLRCQLTSLYLESRGSSTSLANLTLSHVAAVRPHSRKPLPFVELDLHESVSARRQKMEQFTGPGGHLTSARLSLSPAPPHNTRHYELVVLASAPTTNSTSHNQHQRYQVVFLEAGHPGNRSHPHQVCLHTELSSPSLPAMDRLDKLLQAPLTARLGAKLLSGGRCRGAGAEVASLKAEVSVSGQQLQHLSRHLPGECNFDRLDPTTSLRREAFYDALLGEIAWKQEVPGMLLNASYHAGTALRGLAFPFTSSDCLGHSSSAPQRHISFNITRSLDSRTATGWVRRPGCQHYVEDLPVPHLLDQLLPLHGRHGLRHTSQYHGSDRHLSVSGVVPPADQCYVLPQRVVTFDGVAYEMEPSECNRVVLKHVDGPDGLLILSSRAPLEDPLSSPHPAPLQRLRILRPAAAIDITITGFNVTVNGSPALDPLMEVLDPVSQQLLVRIVNTGPTIEVSFPSLLQLLLKEGNRLTVRLEDFPRYRGTVEGLCGNFDGASQGDLVGPRGCMYPPTEGVVFAAAWSVLPCKLGDTVARELRRQRWTCPKNGAELGQPEDPSFDPSSCSHLVHRLVTEPGQLCLTTVPVTTCTAACTTLHGTDREAVFEVKCWPLDRLPDSVQRAAETGYLPYLEEAPGTMQPSLLSYPMECIPRRES